MKRLSILIGLLTLMVGIAEAKGIVSYQGEIDLGYSYGISNDASECVHLHTIQGIKVGKYFSTGVGAGFDYYYNFDDSSEAMIPVYLNLKGYLPVGKKVSTYLSCDAGWSFGVTGDLNNNNGLTVTPAIGVVWGLFKAQVGYTIQNVKGVELGNLNMGAVQLKVGIMF